MSSVSQHSAIFLYLRLFTAAFCNFVWSTVYDISCVGLDDTAVDLIALLTVLAFFMLNNFVVFVSDWTHVVHRPR